MHISTTNPSGRSSPDSSIELVGQLAASNLTNWRLGQFCKGIALPTRGIHIEGPAGCGKSTLLSVLAARHELPVLGCQAMDLVTGPDGKPRSLESLVSDLVSQPGFRTDKRFVVHMQNMDMLLSGLAPDLAVFAFATICAALRKESFTVLTTLGERMAVSFQKNMLFVAESRSGVKTTRTIGFGQKPLLATATPYVLDELMSIRCEPLDGTHFSQLARCRRGPLNAIISEMSAKAGLDIEIDEAALDELATRAHAAQPSDGGYALASLLLECIEDAVSRAPAPGVELGMLRLTGSGLRPQVEWRQASTQEEAGVAPGLDTCKPKLVRPPRASEGDVRLATFEDLLDLVINP